MKKKVLSLLFAVMCMCLFATVSATAATRDDAIDWVRSKEGQYVGNGQCVGLIAEYYKYLGVSTVSGNACDYATNALPSGWTREKGGIPQKGDILVYTGGYGHVAIAETTQYSWHQNWGGQYVQWVDRYYSNSFYSSYEGVTKTYWGCIRPNFASNSEPPTTVGMICDKENGYIKTNTQVTFEFWATNAESFDIIIERNGSEYKRFNNVSNPFYFTPTEIGDYLAYAVAKNSAGSTEANRRKFYVTPSEPPTTVGMICDHENGYIKTNTQVTFEFWATNAESFDIVVERNGSEYKRFNNVSNPFYFTPTEIGNYLAYGVAKNSVGSTEANRRNFYVTPSEPPTTVGMICDKENGYIKTNTQVTFEFWATNAESFDIIIERNGSEYKRFNNVSNPFYFTPTESGDYLAYGVAKNSIGTTEANRRKFYAVSPLSSTSLFTVNEHTGYAEITNNTSGTKTAEVIIAQYDNDILTSVTSEKITFSPEECKKIECGSKKYKIFVWDSLKSMKPLT